MIRDRMPFLVANGEVDDQYSFMLITDRPDEG